MKYFAPLCALLLAASMPGFAVSANQASLSPQNQFHFKPTGRRALQAAAHHITGNQAPTLSKQHGPVPRTVAPTVQSHRASAKNVHRHTANPATGKIGFLSAAQIPAANGVYSNALAGDFNGDGTPDIASEVEYYDTNSSTYLYAIAIVISNGDGTFKPAVLSSTTDTCAALFVADVNGDGKSDLIVGHEPNNCGNSNTNPAFDVWLSNGDGTFTLSSNVNNTIPTSGVAGGTLADVNGDGKLDIVLVDDNNPANVFTLLGNGDGTFQVPTSVALSGEAGYNAVVADVNGDGLLDIVDNDYSTNQVTVYLATSPTTYGSPASYDTVDHNRNACSLTVGDLSGDGKPEIVNTNCSNSGNDITVYVNNGDSTFATGAYYDSAMSGGTNSGPAAIYTYGASIADVNGDGKGDIVTSNLYGSDVTVLFGKSDGTVSVPTNGYATGGYLWNFSNPISPVVADFNGDGFADIVVPDGIGSFVYLRGYGDGTFRSARDYYASADAAAGSYGIASGDFNGDGHPDFVIGSNCNSCTNPLGITVFLSNPDGSLQPGITYGSSSTMWFAAVADFNGDGKLDIAATDNVAGTVQFFYGDGTGNFTVGPTLNTDLANNAPYGVFVGDFNNDGHPDMAIANYNTPDITILLNDANGTGNFGAPLPTTLSGGAWQGVAVADLNGDGNLDLVLPYWYGTTVGVLLGNGDGTFQPEQGLGLPDTDGVAVADFNGDGKLDIAVTSFQGGGQDIAIALGNGDGTFGSFTFFPSSLQDYILNAGQYGGGPAPQSIQAVDVDGDGKVDLVYTNAFYGTVGVLFGQGNGNFYDAVEYPAGEYVWGLVVADVNGDGAPDVVVANDGNPSATVLLNNNGSATLGSYTIGTSAQGATITAGQSATFTLTITPSNHYNGTVTFTCPTGLPQLATCTFSPSSVTLDGLAPVTVKLTITTTAPTASLQIPAGIDPHGNSPKKSPSILLASLSGMGVLGMFLAGSFSKKHNRWSVLGLLALGMTLFLVGCGGSSSSTSTPPPPTKSNTASTVTSSSSTVLVGQGVTFTGTVSANSGTPTGTVKFLDGTTTLGTGTLSSGKATFQTSALAAGVHSITIAYGGASGFNSSTSTPLSQTVDTPGTATGSYSVTVSGTGTAGTNGVGKANQSINLSVVVQ